MANGYSGQGGAGSPTIKTSADGGTVSGQTTITPDPTLNLVAGTGITLNGTASNTVVISSSGGAGVMTSWILRGNSGVNQTITDAEQVTFSGSGGLTTVAGAVDLLTIQTTGVLEDLNTLGAPTADGEFIVATGAGAFSYETGATVRNSLGLGTMATQDANAVAITGGTISGVTGLAEPSVGSANQLNVSDGSGGWDTASLYYGTASNGQFQIGTSILTSYTFTALAGNGSGGNVALFQTLEPTASVVFQSSTSTSTNVAIKSNNNTMTLVSGGVDFAFPTADGSNGDVLTTDGAGSLSFTTPTGGVTLTGSTNNTISTVTGANALQGEANLTFDGTVLTVTGNLSVGVDATSTVGFMGVTPVVQQNANPYSANPTDPSSLASLSATADGNFGDLQNSIGSIITALQQYGLLA